MVGAERFELPTLWSQTRCATRLRYAPNKMCQHFYEQAVSYTNYHAPASTKNDLRLNNLAFAMPEVPAIARALCQGSSMKSPIFRPISFETPAFNSRT